MIENRQKTPSGPQGVLLGVPKDPQTTQMAIQDAKMWLPKLTNIKLWCQKGGKPESRRVKDWGPAAEGEALKIRRARPWPAVGVGKQPPRKVPTFPEGNPGVCALCRRPTQQRSKIMLFLTCSKNLKNVTKLPPRGSPNGARNLKNLKKMPSGCLLKSKLGKKTEIVRILTPSNPLKRAKTNTKTQFSRFHPDTKKSQK